MRRAALAAVAAALCLALAPTALGAAGRAAMAPAGIDSSGAGGATSAGAGAVASAGSGATEGARASCRRRRHSKRVSRRVRRHGRLRTVRTTRHWWTCEPAPAPAPAAAEPPPPSPAPAPAPAPLPGPAPTPEPEPELEPGPNRLGVKAAEYSYTLSRPSVSAGEVTIELDNRGQDAHNLNLAPLGEEAQPLQIEETGSLQRRRAHFDLEPGVYRLWCSLPTHDEEGMHATLVVEAP